MQSAGTVEEADGYLAGTARGRGKQARSAIDCKGKG